MGYAISLVADNATSQPIRALWDRVSEMEDASSMAALDYPPHITLAIYDDIDFAQVQQATRRAFNRPRVTELSFEQLDYFDNTPLVVWAASNPSGDLQAIFNEIHGSIDPALCRLHYRPGNWVAHCSLGTSISEDRRTDAIEFTKQPLMPFTVRFDIADTVSFPPLNRVEQWPLG